MRKKSLSIVKMTRDSHLVLRIKDISPRLISKIKDRFTIANPKYFNLQRLGKSTWNVNKYIKTFEVDLPFIFLPRGAEKEMVDWIHDDGSQVQLLDRTTTGTRLDIEPSELRFNGKLRPYQDQADEDVLGALSQPDISGCLFRGPCGSGKTVCCLGLIYKLKLPTIVVVHSNALARQWSENIVKWLGVAPGSIGGGGKDNIKFVTVAMQQTLWRRANENPSWINSFGLVIGDECFEANTPILMADETKKKISDIKIGDEVAIGGKVKRTFKNKYTGHMFLLNGFQVTPNHPIATENGWIPIAKIKKNDLIFCNENQHEVKNEEKNKTLYHLWKKNKITQQIQLVSKTWKRTIRSFDRKVQNVWRNCFKKFERNTHYDKMQHEKSLECWFDSEGRSTRQKIRRCQKRYSYIRRTKKKNDRINKKSNTRIERTNEEKFINSSDEEICQARRNRKKQKSNFEINQRREDKIFWWAKPWKWYAINFVRTCYEKKINSTWIYPRVYCQDRLSKLFAVTLQDRFCTSKNENSCRSRWWKSQWKKKKNDGRTKDRFSRINGMEGYEIPSSFRLQPSIGKVQKGNESVIDFPTFNFETENGVYVASDVLVHNCHHWAANTFQVVSSMFSAKYRVGASADERRKDKLDILVSDAFGPLVHKIKKSDLIGFGNLVPTKLEVVKTNYCDGIFIDSKLDKKEMGLDWVGMINRMVADDERNDIILQKIVQILETDKSARLLVLSERVDVCYYYAEEINTQTNLVAGVMVGGLENRAELEKTMAGLQTGEIRVGFGTSVADEGLDIPPLTHVLLTCPVYNHPKRMIQMIGRAARPWKGKKYATAIYFWDQDMFPVTLIDTSEDKIEQLQNKFLRKLKRSTDVCSIKVV